MPTSTSNRGGRLIDWYLSLCPVWPTLSKLSSQPRLGWARDVSIGVFMEPTNGRDQSNTKTVLPMTILATMVCQTWCFMTAAGGAFLVWATLSKSPSSSRKQPQIRWILGTPDGQHGPASFSRMDDLNGTHGWSAWHVSRCTRIAAAVLILVMSHNGSHTYVWWPLWKIIRWNKNKKMTKKT